MKKLFVKKDVPCMACLECVRACSTAFYKEFHQDKACLKIVERNGKVRPMTCVQCGKCAAACEHGAITQNPKTGVYMVNKKLCVGCGKCVEACPFGVSCRLPVRLPPRSASPAVSVSRPARWRSSRSARADFSTRSPDEERYRSNRRKTCPPKLSAGQVFR